MTKKKTDQDALMIRYLLGEATDEEQKQLEEQFFTDDDGFQQLLALEDELRYEFAQGGLTPQQRKSFEKRFMATPEGREKVALAKAVLTKTQEAHPIQTPSRWRAFVQSLIPQGLGIRASLAGAALALLVVAGGTWMMVQTVQLRNQVTQLQASRRTADQDAQRQLQAQQTQLAQNRTRISELEQQLSKHQTPFLTFILAPGLTRDAADSMKRLVVPANAGEVQLQLDVRSKGTFQSYRAELQNLDGSVLWSQNVPQPTVSIPARFLSQGDYMLDLKAVGANGGLVDAGEFYFQVVRR
ncbi:MAG TPA: hypothetical protein VKV15_03105 [Bryobacteraceae bacterium]|nr:hypothetical protein [Bryobacteraceae bacterium]